MSKVIAPVLYVLFGLLHRQMVMLVTFSALGVLWFFFFPLWEIRYYVNHYKGIFDWTENTKFATMILTLCKGNFNWRAICMVAFFWVGMNNCWSQTLSGKVLNDRYLPINEANILNKHTDHHTHTNELGMFTLENTKIGDTLQITKSGYQTKYVLVLNIENVLEITLEEKAIQLDEVVIAPKLDALHVMTDIDIQTNPVNSSQDIMRKVPGLFIGQHAGGGKAEQMFLRGFDIDHGTDIQINVDGIPVNMVSHAHGQGYADLHFVIPETIDKIDFGKGPYYENKGNFSTAGYVDFATKQKLENSTIKLESGQYNTYRLMGMFNVLDSKKQSAYLATEFLSTDGFFESPQNFNRINLFGKYTGTVNSHDKIGVIVSYFDSKWDASGQVPERAVKNGLISRFGSIDNTEGGATSRSNLKVNYDKIIDDNTTLKSTVYYSQYAFDLFSNFTFFLEDSINGDQIQQKEKRSIYGFNSDYSKKYSIGSWQGSLQIGIALRNDKTHNTELSHTKNRIEHLGTLKLGDINETNLGAYIGTFLDYKKWTINPSVRIDGFDFQYNDVLSGMYQTKDVTSFILSPKLNILYNPTSKLQWYLKTGKGFHSNDTRVVVIQNGKKTLPAAYGSDLGFIWKPTSKMLLNMAYWYLFLEQEFVYVGDAGIVEPSGKTRRHGIEMSYRYQPWKWLFWNLDMNYTYARSINDPKGENYIPLAPNFTAVSGLNVRFKSNFYGGINARFLANRAANEDYSIVAKGYTVVDVNAGYQWKKMSLAIQIQNVLNTEWNETQFATISKLKNEMQPVEEIHFTPGTPFFMKAMLSYHF